MKVVIQRVTSASVTVEEEIVGQIGPGIMILLGVEKGDAEAQAAVTRLRPTASATAQRAARTAADAFVAQSQGQSQAQAQATG